MKSATKYSYNLWIYGAYYSLLSIVCLAMCFMISQLVFTPLPCFLNINFISCKQNHPLFGLQESMMFVYAMYFLV